MSNYVAAFEESVRRVASGGRSEFFDSFYERFIGSDPEVAEKFAKTDLERQKKVLRVSLTEMAAFVVGHEITDYMISLARVHGKRDRDIRPELYDRWLETLIETVRDHDPEFGHDVELAWRLVLAPGIAFMKFEYDH